jgi:atypical dual specificity phosphatase
VDRGSRESDGGRVASVRPFGYVEPEPVIARVGDRDCFIGNALAADPSAHDRRFEHVLSATEERQPSTTHHHPLVDGPGNHPAAFAAAVDDARDLLGGDGDVLVHCKAGISRSATLLATAIAAEEARSFRSALAAVRDARPPATPHPKLHQAAVVYLAARDHRHVD